MGYGILHVDFEVIKDALFLPEDCKIIAIGPGGLGTKGADLMVVSPSVPNVTVDEATPRLIAICKQEVPPDHECPKGFERCKKVTTTLEVSKY